MDNLLVLHISFYVDTRHYSVFFRFRNWTLVVSGVGGGRSACVVVDIGWCDDERGVSIENRCWQGEGGGSAPQNMSARCSPHNQFGDGVGGGSCSVLNVNVCGGADRGHQNDPGYYASNAHHQWTHTTRWSQGY